MRGWEFINTLIRRQRVRDILQAQIKIDGFEIDLRLVRQRGKQRAQFRGKIKGSILDRVIDRFLAHAVARQEQLSVFAIPQRKSRLAAQTTYALVAILFIEVEDAFRVGARPKLMTALDEVGIQLREIMRFAV